MAASEGTRGKKPEGRSERERASASQIDRYRYSRRGRERERERVRGWVDGWMDG
jgi:hypothetical protein